MSGIRFNDRAFALGQNRLPRIQRHAMLDSGADERRLRMNAGHRLPLHIRTHQSAGRVIVFQKRNQRSGNGYNLPR